MTLTLFVRTGPGESFDRELRERFFKSRLPSPVALRNACSQFGRRVCIFSSGFAGGLVKVPLSRSEEKKGHDISKARDRA